ncbi:MAG TPA: hypothetical protein VG165_17635 [Solirubrobacteraceae bacterium]|jgi:hypothetical protein|nr:hypothetical protein [Solirubrobacteraceae bacterium]
MSNVSGQAYAFLAITPIVPGEERGLREKIDTFARTRPFARLPRTHFARLVILDDWVNDPSQPKQDHLKSRYLIFSTTFDGPRDTYLDALCQELAPEAKQIWGRCVGCPETARGAPLKRYLLHNQIDIGFFVAAYPHATVEQVRAGLDRRRQIAEFAIRTQVLAPGALRAAYRKEF